MPVLRKNVGSHARRADACAWAREVVGELPPAVGPRPGRDDRLTAYASHIVATACLKVRNEEGAEACRTLLEAMILSAAHVASGAAGESPASMLRELAHGLDDEIAPVVRERANA